MRPFTTLHGIAAPLPQANINTDAIIPSNWLRAPDGNLAEGLFGTLRAEGKSNFVLNRAPFSNARVLVVGGNFGCGSSREAAVWALVDFGIACVIAPSFADIFYENAFKNGVLAAIVTQQEAATLAAHLAAAASPVLTVDLSSQRVTGEAGLALGFVIPPERKSALLAGRDELDDLIGMMPEIQTFQQRDRVARPWVYGAAPERGR
jgi:3-isopropylmalate/(R)-2-methylmalate dehydratase small subunit